MFSCIEPQKTWEWMGPIFVGHFSVPLNCSPHVHFCFRFRLYITNPHCWALVLLLIVVPSGRCAVFLLVCVLYLLVSASVFLERCWLEVFSFHCCSSTFVLCAVSRPSRTSSFSLLAAFMWSDICSVNPEETSSPAPFPNDMCWPCAQHNTGTCTRVFPYTTTFQNKRLHK